MGYALVSDLFKLITREGPFPQYFCDTSTIFFQPGWTTVTYHEYIARNTETYLKELLVKIVNPVGIYLLKVNIRNTKTKGPKQASYYLLRRYVFTWMKIIVFVSTYGFVMITGQIEVNSFEFA